MTPKEIMVLAEDAARFHFRDNRDAYETMAFDILDAWNNPPHHLSPHASLGAFLRGVARNNFYYEFCAAKGFEPTAPTLNS